MIVKEVIYEKDYKGWHFRVIRDEQFDLSDFGACVDNPAELNIIDKDDLPEELLAQPLTVAGIIHNEPVEDAWLVQDTDAIKLIPRKYIIGSINVTNTDILVFFADYRCAVRGEVYFVEATKEVDGELITEESFCYFCKDHDWDEVIKGEVYPMAEAKIEERK